MRKILYIFIALLIILGVAVCLVFWAGTSETEYGGSVGEISTIKQNLQNAALPPQTVLLGAEQSITWNKSNFPTDFVRINVIRKVSDVPAAYELIRILSESTANDGSATWVPSQNELGKGVYIEIGCVDSTVACSPSISMTSIAVNSSDENRNTAAAYQVIEERKNR